MRRSIHAFIRCNRESELSLSQINALFRLYHQGLGSVQDLAKHLGITNAAVSQLLDPLIDAGLLDRSENPNDRRRKRLTLTADGQRLVEDRMRKWHAWTFDLVKILTDAEMAQILPAIRLLNLKMKEFNSMEDHLCLGDSRNNI